MKTESLNGSLLRIGLPIFAGLLVNQIQQITDQAFLGHSSAEYLSAVGNSGSTIWTTVSFLFALGTGTSILVSQKLGEGDSRRAGEFLGATFVFSSFFSLLIFSLWFFAGKSIFLLMGLTDPVLGYAVLYTRICSFSLLFSGINSAAQAVYNGTGHTRPVMISAGLRAGINIVLDWLLIFGNLGFPKMGIAGAAVATLTAEIIGGAYYISAAFGKKLPVRLSPDIIRTARLKNYVAVMKMGVPASLEEFAWNIGSILLLRFLNLLDPLAAGIYTVIMSITLVPALCFIALGNAAMTLSGRKTGEGNPGEIRRTGNRALLISWIASSVFFAVFVIFPGSIVGLFTRDTEVITRAGKMLLICSFALYPRSANIIFGGAIRGMGDTKWMLISQLFGTVFVLIAARLLMFNFSMGILGLFLAVFLDELLRSIINGARFRYRSRT